MPGCEMSEFFFENIPSPTRKWISKMTEEKIFQSSDPKINGWNSKK